MLVNNDGHQPHGQEAVESGAVSSISALLYAPVFMDIQPCAYARLLLWLRKYSPRGCGQ